MKKSFFLKILLFVLVGCLLITAIAMIAKKTGVQGNEGEKVNTPTETLTNVDVGGETTMSEVDLETTEPPISSDWNIPEGYIEVATHENAVIGVMLNNTDQNGAPTDETNKIRYVFYVPDLKLNTEYKVCYSVSDLISTVYYGINIMYQTPGMEFPKYFTANNGADMYNNEFEFTTNSAVTQYLYFYVAEGDYGEGVPDYTELAEAVKECVTFAVYEKAAN